MAELEFAVDGAIARATINRPDRRNAMSVDVMRGLREAVQHLEDDVNLRALVITGAGERAFCVGADLAGMAGEGVAASHEGRGLLADLFRDMWRSGKPIIARVRGYALAGGFGLAMACDLVVASDDAQFGTPEIDVGLWPYMITVPLLRVLTVHQAFDLMSTGRRIDANEAQRLGLVNRVVPAAHLDATVDELARVLASKSPLTMRWGKRSLYRASEMSADAALEYLQGMLSLTIASEDAAEGVSAFLEKRPPVWKGR